MSLCTGFCKPCDYRKHFAGGMDYCDYICMVGKPRPCPAGDGCKVRMVNGVPDDEALRKQTAEEKVARRKEQVRVNARRYYERNREERKAYMREYNRANRDLINQRNRERIRKKREEMRRNG
jgi:hypothetical protein